MILRKACETLLEFDFERTPVIYLPYFQVLDDFTYQAVTRV